MARHLVRSFWFAILGASFVLEGCSKPWQAELAHPPQAVSGHAAAADQTASAPVHHPEQKTSERLPTLSDASTEQYQTEDPPPWLAEMLHSPDPNVRVQGLDAWARHPSTSLDPITYALVDPDESVRARAQALFEEALARR